MPRALQGRLTYANVVATIALFIALGGGAYATTRLPAGSVGTRELRNGSVTKAKLARSTLKALAGKRGPAGTRGATGAVGAQGVTGAIGAAGATGAAGTRGDQGVPGQTGAIGGVLPHGATLVGSYLSDGTSTPDADRATIVSFGYRLATIPTTEVRGPFSQPTAHCTGTVADPTAAPGYFCIYSADTLGSATADEIRVLDTETNYGAVGHTGVQIYALPGSFSDGTWAVTAG